MIPFLIVSWQSRLALKPDGLFLAAILGGETLRLRFWVFMCSYTFLHCEILICQCLCFRELRIACTVAQMEREGGISPRLSPLAQVFVNWLHTICFFPSIFGLVHPQFGLIGTWCRESVNKGRLCSPWSWCRWIHCEIWKWYVIYLYPLYFKASSAQVQKFCVGVRMVLWY